MITKVKKFLSFKKQDKKLVLEAFFTVSIIRIGLGILPFRVMWNRFNKQVGQDTASNPSTINKVTFAVDAVSNYVPGAVCLARALTVQKMLFDRGYQSQIHIGTAKNDEGVFLAHAWVVRNDTIIIGELEGLSTYNTFPLEQAS